MITEALRELRPFLASRSYKLFLTGGLAVLSGLAEAIALFLVVRVAVGLGGTDTLTRLGGATLSVRQMLGLAFVAESVAWVGHIFISRLSADLCGTVLHESRRTAIRRYVHAPWAVQSVQREGALQELVTMLSFRTAEMAQWLAFGFAQAIILLMFIGSALIVDWRFTTTILAAGGLVVLLMRPVAKATQTRAQEFVTSNSAYAEEVSRIASASMELKAFGVEVIAEQQLDDLDRTVSGKLTRSRFSALFSASAFKDIAVFLLIGSVAGLYVLGDQALASAGVVITLIIRGLASAQQASASYQAVSESAPNLRDFNRRLLAMKTEPPEPPSVTIGQFSSLSLADVSYRYDADDAPALSGVNLEINKGDFVGIVGPSGGGKSTLLQLILRLRHPSSGALRVNGSNYLGISAEEWHQLVSLVPQEPSLLEASIEDNIAYYRRVSSSAVREAARAANIYDEVMRLPAGFDTRLGPRGTGLSGGQKQRIAIARAVVGRPALLVMDEPTSALDPASENVVLETIDRLRGQTTLLLVAHRMSTVARCDYLLKVDDGYVHRLSMTG